MSWLLWTQESGVKVKQSGMLAEPHFNIFLESGGYHRSCSATAPHQRQSQMPYPPLSGLPFWVKRIIISLPKLPLGNTDNSFAVPLLDGDLSNYFQRLYLYIDYHISRQPYVGICFGEQTLLKAEPSVDWRVFLVRAWRYVHFLEVFWISLLTHCCHGSQVHGRRQHQNLQRFNCWYGCPLYSVWNS